MDVDSGYIALRLLSFVVQLQGVTMKFATTKFSSLVLRLGLCSALCLAFLIPISVHALDTHDGKLVYRGFTVDMSDVQGEPNLAEIEAYAKHQLDIVADCGVKEELLTFFRSESIIMNRGAGGGGGHSMNGGIMLDPKPQKASKPIFLHEFMHSLHHGYLPQGNRNPDVLLYYQRAKSSNLYPADAYVLKNPGEFFAVTGSLYLWGTVDRPPFTRAALEKAQPNYCQWLAKLFGVQK